MDHETKKDLLQDKHNKLDQAHNDIVTKYEQMKEEYEELVKFKDEATQKLMNYNLDGNYKEKALQLNKDKVEHCELTIKKNEEVIADTKHQLDKTIVKYTSAQMKVQEL